ncbi:chlorhexidine efflux transporter, partial [Pseudomonas aeruginosa]
MTHTHTALDKTLKERIFHALAFEGLAVLLTAPVLSLVMNKPLAHMGALTLMFSTV